MSHAEFDSDDSARTAEQVEVISRCRLVETANEHRIFWRQAGSEFTARSNAVATPRSHQPAGDDGQEDWRARLQRMLEVTRRYFAAPLPGLEHGAPAPHDPLTGPRPSVRTRRAVLSAGRRGTEPMRGSGPIQRGATRASRAHG